MAGKRAAEAAPSAPPRPHDKKQRTGVPPKTPNPSKQPARKASSGAAFVVPATPGTIVDLPARGKQHKSAPERQPQKQPQGPPSTLPLEPHAAILAQLQAKYTVRVLSVISSTRMEKRIKAILDHLGGAGTALAPPLPLPGVVLLHARAADANKLVSIVEIVKRRIREGHLAAAAAPAAAAKSESESMTDGPPPPAMSSKTKTKTKTNRKSAQASTVAWYQYDRIYDVKTARKKKKQHNTGEDAAKDGDGTDGTDGTDDTDDDEDDSFEPMMHRLESALGGVQGSATKVTTYMSILLSRVPLSELHKNPEISVQCSTDPLEVEYEEYMAGA